MYEPCHGSAPDIAGQGLSNPLAAILSGAMMLRYSLNMAQAAEGIEAAVGRVLDQGLRTTDIATEHSRSEERRVGKEWRDGGGPDAGEKELECEGRSGRGRERKEGGS